MQAGIGICFVRGLVTLIAFCRLPGFGFWHRYGASLARMAACRAVLLYIVSTFVSSPAVCNSHSDPHTHRVIRVQQHVYL